MSTLESNSISEYLGGEFSRRKVRNPGYSLRAFARDLQISPSRLSEVMKGQQGLSETSVDTMAERLTQKPRERKFLKDLVLSQHSRNANVRAEALRRIQEVRRSESFRRLREDEFRIISDWYHGAILEMIQVEGFQPDIKWIARRLGIATSSARAAVERLEKLGLLARHADGQWVARTEAFSAFSEHPSSAIRKFHLQILGMHADSLREDHLNDRQFLSMVLAVPRVKLPDFKIEMQKFMTQFWQKIESDSKDDLYSLSVQLCPVRNRRPEEKEND